MLQVKQRARLFSKTTCSYTCVTSWQYSYIVLKFAIISCTCIVAIATFYHSKLHSFCNTIFCSSLHFAFSVLYCLLSDSINCCTVEPPNKGHFGDNINYKFSCCVLCREVVLSSEVQNVLEL